MKFKTYLHEVDTGLVWVYDSIYIPYDVHSFYCDVPATVRLPVTLLKRIAKALRSGESIKCYNRHYELVIERVE